MHTAALTCTEHLPHSQCRASTSCLLITYPVRAVCYITDFWTSWEHEAGKVWEFSLSRWRNWVQKGSVSVHLCAADRAELGSGDSSWFYQPSASQIVVGSACFFAFIVNLPFVRHFCKTQYLNHKRNNWAWTLQQGQMAGDAFKHSLSQSLYSPAVD